MLRTRFLFSAVKDAKNPLLAQRVFP